jgi:hypothetical protein
LSTQSGLLGSPPSACHRTRLSPKPKTSLTQNKLSDTYSQTRQCCFVICYTIPVYIKCHWVGRRGSPWVTVWVTVRLGAVVERMNIQKSRFFFDFFGGILSQNCRFLPQHGDVLYYHSMCIYIYIKKAPLASRGTFQEFSPTRVRGMTGAIFGMTGAKGTACSEWKWRHRP